MGWFSKKQIEEVDYKEFAQKVIEYVKECRKQGKSDEVIKKSLKGKKYPDTLISYIFERIDSLKPLKLSFEEEVFKTLRLGKRYLIKSGDINRAFDLMVKRISNLKGGKNGN